VFVADGHDKKVIILQRDTMAEVGGSDPAAACRTVPGRRQHRRRFTRQRYTGEQHHGKRVQKWTPAGETKQRTKHESTKEH
jgi:hypothetical protein